MDIKKIMLIIGALAIALGAAFGVNRMMRGSATPNARAAAAPQIEGPKVLVATRALPVGTILTPELLRFQAWPQDLVRTQDYYVEGEAQISALVGSVIRVAATAGAPLTHGAIVNPQDRGFLAAALGPGMRAVSVPLSPDQGVAGFVFPGDRVDVLLTLELENEADNAIKLTTSETVVRNLRVLAVDQRTAPTDEAGASTPTIFQNVTLEATPRIAEMIAVSRSVGTLSLALRSIAETSAELEEAIATGAVTVPNDGDAGAEARMLRRAASRPTVGGSTPVSGGDVSRNLRRAMPSRASVEAARAAQNNSGGGGGGNGGPSNRGSNEAALPPVQTGPVVRVVRGDQVSVVPVRGN